MCTSESFSDFYYECERDYISLLSLFSDENSESSDTQDYGDSVTDESTSDDDFNFEKQIGFISVFDTKYQKQTLFICYYQEILEYRKKYEKLNQKNQNSVNTLWGNVKVYIPWLGHVPLNLYDYSLVGKTAINSNNNQAENLLQDNKDIKIVTPNKNKKNLTKISNENQITGIINSTLTNTDKLDSNTIQVSNNINKIEETDEKETFSITVSSQIKEKSEVLQSNSDKNKVKRTPKKNKTNFKENNLQPGEKKIFKDSRSEEKAVETIIELNITNNLHVNDSINSVEKISKKKQKKLKQKKKIQNEEERDLSNSRSIIKNTETQMKYEKISKNSTVDCQSSNQDIEENTSDTENHTEEEHIQYMLKKNFYIERFKYYAKMQNNKSNEKTYITSKTSEAFESYENDNEDFVSKSKKRIKCVPVPQSNIKGSNKCGENAIEMILQNNLTKALNYLTQAIILNQSDYRHYLNRCYCYLRIENPLYALADAKIVIQNSKNLGFLFIANLRAGQSASLLKRYQQAETFLREALHIYPDSPHAQRELLRVQINHIMEHDHPEKNAIFALENCSTTADAIKYLNETYIPKCDDDNDPGIFIFNDEYDDLIYESDDESSNTEALNKLMTCKPQEMKFCHVAQTLLLWLRPLSRFENPKNFSVSSKTSSGKNEKVRENAVWIGNLTSELTEIMIKKAFKQYGNVLSVHIIEGKQYGFVNFERREDAAKLLSSATTVRVHGVGVVVRASMRKD